IAEPLVRQLVHERAKLAIALAGLDNRRAEAGPATLAVVIVAVPERAVVHHGAERDIRRDDNETGHGDRNVRLLQLHDVDLLARVRGERLAVDAEELIGHLPVGIEGSPAAGSVDVDAHLEAVALVLLAVDLPGDQGGIVGRYVYIRFQVEGAAVLAPRDHAPAREGLVGLLGAHLPVARRLDRVLPRGRGITVGAGQDDVFVPARIQRAEGHV